MKKKKVWSAMITWLIIAFLFWVAVIFITNDPIKYQILYYSIWILVFGSLIWYFREPIKKELRAWSIHPLIKFLLLVYGMVLLEEIFASFSLHLKEGFNILIYPQRIGQFWALNIIAFTGLAFALYFILKKINYSDTEIFFLAGVWGLYAEHTLMAIIGNPLAFIMYFPLVVFTYGIIITPALWSLEQRGNKNINLILKYPLTLLVIFIFSVIPLVILTTLRNHFPMFFPPRTLVPYP